MRIYFRSLNLNKSVFKKFFLEHHIESLNEVIVEESKISELSTSAKTYLLSNFKRIIQWKGFSESFGTNQWSKYFDYWQWNI